MCSYCGCESESVIKALMDDHVAISAIAGRIVDGLDRRQFGFVEPLVRELADFFDNHRREEEAGLFAQLRDAGEARKEVERLIAEHRWLSGGLSRADIVERPGDLRRLLLALHRHAVTEDTDLFPYAMQMLPDGSWALAEEVHRRERLDATPLIHARPVDPVGARKLYSRWVAHRPTRPEI